MANSEKGLLFPNQSNYASQSRSRYVGKLLIHAIAIAFILRASFGLHERFTSGEDSRTSLAKCPQVEPLVPGQQTEALKSMEEFILSDQFRNETVARLAGAVRIPTISYDDLAPVGEDPRWDAFFNFASYLKTTFPLVHSQLRLEKVNTHGLLYTWHGSDPDARPTVLMGHQDTVPVVEATEDQWTHPPFDGYFDGRYIWGRGSNDCKNVVIGILEAVELLLQADFKPKRTIVLSFGFDEEISGRNGARHLAKALVDRYGQDGAAVVVDEGAGTSSMWGSLFAQPGVGEKGHIDVEIIIRMPGGHSSIPPAHNGIGVAAQLISLIEANPYEPHFHAENPFLGLLECGNAHSPDFPAQLKKHLPWKERSCAAKKDKLALEAAKLGDEVKYLFTTSLAPDIISGGVKANALPERIRILVNHRINVGDSVRSVQSKIASLAEQIAAKHNLTVQAFNDEPEAPRTIKLNSDVHALEPAPITPTSVEGTTPYSVLSGTTRALYGPDMLVAPGIMTGNTDTRLYWDLTRHIFRYGPGWDPEGGSMFDDGGIHTVNEKVSVVAHTRGVQWYSTFMRNMDEAELE
ncbi:peptidase family M20/M25/M40 [Xylariaceae sp. FL1019]|nr:peptidase family M20/M25/M40 [Xylariaceae sp. FL1019]